MNRGAPVLADERERRAGLRSRAHVERAAVGLRDRAGDEEAQPGPRLGRARHVHAAEFLEDAPLLLLRNAGSRVPHRDAHGAVARCRRDPHLPALRRVLDGVVDQIREHLTQASAVAADARERAWNARHDLDGLASEICRRDGLLDDPRHVDVRERVRERPGVDARHIRNRAVRRILHRNRPHPGEERAQTGFELITSGVFRRRSRS